MIIDLNKLSERTQQINNAHQWLHATMHQLIKATPEQVEEFKAGQGETFKMFQACYVVLRENNSAGGQSTHVPARHPTVRQYRAHRPQ